MTREEAKQAAEVIQAYIEGKPIQYGQIGGTIWKDIPEPNFDFISCEYRIKPEPELIPWDASTFPVNAAFRHGNDGFPTNWMDVNGDGVLLGFPGNRCYTTWEGLKRFWTHTVDGGITWKACGVVKV